MLIVISLQVLFKGDLLLKTQNKTKKQMKQKLSLILNVVLLVAVVLLYVLHFSSSCRVKSGADKKSTAVKADSLNMLPIAYINTDTLLQNYTFSKEANERLLAKSQKSEAELAKRMNQWQKEGMEFQKKLQANLFLSQERAEQENARLMKKRQELEQLQAKLTRELMAEQQEVNEQLKDTIDTFLKEYNKTKKYQLILSNTLNDNVLYSEEGCDITSEVVELLNERIAKK